MPQVAAAATRCRRTCVLVKRTACTEPASLARWRCRELPTRDRLLKLGLLRDAGSRLERHRGSQKGVTMIDRQLTSEVLSEGRQDLRQELLGGLPVTEQRLLLSGISTAVLQGGNGPPMVLLHGPGGYAAHFMRLIPKLTPHYRVVAPDLPGHGAS